jgi:hypothetical protein
MQEITVNVFEKIGSTAAVSSADGELLFKLIAKALKNKAKVVLDFKNIELITSTFLNAAIGQLYGFFDDSDLKKQVSVTNMANDDLALLKKVVERAKEYFEDREDVEMGIKDGLRE